MVTAADRGFSLPNVACALWASCGFVPRPRPAGRGKRGVVNCLQVLSLCLVMSYVTSAQISLASANHLAPLSSQGKGVLSFCRVSSICRDWHYKSHRQPWGHWGRWRNIILSQGWAMNHLLWWPSRRAVIMHWQVWFYFLLTSILKPVRLQSQLLLVDEGLIGGSGVGGQSFPSPRALSGRCMLSNTLNEARASAWVEAALHVS